MATPRDDLPDGGVSLTDFRLAGFLVSRDVPLMWTSVNGKREVVFVFGHPAQKVLAQFPGSPEQKYDSSVKAMHDVVKATLGGRK